MNSDALLAAVRETPDDDAPRLVFADWLEEHGDEKDVAHAALIRVQVELARLPLDDDRRAELLQREDDLRYRHAFVARLGLERWVDSNYVRGFPDRLTFWPQRKQPAGEDLAIMAEMVERLPIRGFVHDLNREGMERLAAWPTLARLTCLETTTGIGKDDTDDECPGLLALVRSPLTANLRRLRLAGWQYDQTTIAEIASSPHLAQLRDLDLSATGWWDSSLMALVRSALPERLERLNLAWVEPEPTLVRHLLNRGRLRELHFGVPGEGEGVARLLGAEALSRLRLLDITGEAHGFDVDELAYPSDHRAIPHVNELLASPLLSGLEELSLRGIALGDEGARVLAASPMARNLVHLRLDLCGLTGDGFRALRPLLAEGRLRRLSLEHNVFTEKDARDLTSWPELGRLHRLSLGYFNQIGDGGRAAVENSPHRHAYLSFG